MVFTQSATNRAGHFIQNPQQGLTQFVEVEKENLKKIANTVRGLCMDTVLKSQSGHIGLPLGGADLLTLLYFGIMNHAPENSKWIDRDRFVLSAGHGSALLYAILHLSGYGLSSHDLKNFRQLGSKTPGHPEYGITEGVECTTGPLGQGIAMAVGMALGESHLSSRFTHISAIPAIPAINHRTFALVGDGCLMEGVSSEATSLAGHLGLNKLIAVYDDNKITIDGSTEISFSEDVPSRFRALGWNVFEADGHSFDSLALAFNAALSESNKAPGSTGPSLIICRTMAGKGLSAWEGKPKVHGNPHTQDDVAKAKKALGLDPEIDFQVSDEVREICARLMQDRSAKLKVWKESFNQNHAAWPQTIQSEWKRRFELTEPFVFSAEQLEDAKTACATRQSSGYALKHAFESVTELLGGSADLAGSNNSTLPGSEFIKKGSYSGNNIHFGVREHAMAAIANGLALHGGIRPYCATFAVFSDYMRPAIRLAALMRLPTLFILTHDSYAVGEDGPTHQPIEHAAALRVIPGLQVFRPADGLETFAAWQVCLNQPQMPAALLLTRQKVEALNQVLSAAFVPTRSFELVVRGIEEGGYVLKETTDGTHIPDKADETRCVTLVASGSEVADTLKAAIKIESTTWKTLQGSSIKVQTKVVSAPNPSALLRNTVVLEKLVPRELLTIAIEAGATQSFAAIVGRNGYVFGLDHFGESAPAEALKAEFGFSTEALVEKIKNAMGLRS